MDKPEDKQAHNPESLARRQALKLVLAGAAAAPLAMGFSGTAVASPTDRSATDPDLIDPVTPWAGVLSETELRTASVLADLILPADDRSPAASAVGVPAFIDEWVSAPYPRQQGDRAIVRGGLAWLNTESFKRGGQPFYALEPAVQEAICAELHDAETAAPELRQAAVFFDRFRWLCMAGFYTTEAGRKDLGYIGNVPLTSFPGATPEQLRHLGLDS